MCVICHLVYFSSLLISNKVLKLVDEGSVIDGASSSISHLETVFKRQYNALLGQIDKGQLYKREMEYPAS